jgi:hypothetical protein
VQRLDRHVPDFPAPAWPSSDADERCRLGPVSVDIRTGFSARDAGVIPDDFEEITALFAEWTKPPVVEHEQVEGRF